MKGQVSEACLGFIRRSGGGGGGVNYNIWPFSRLPLHRHFILFIKFSLLRIDPHFVVGIINFFSRQQRVIPDPLFAYQ